MSKRLRSMSAQVFDEPWAIHAPAMDLIAASVEAHRAGDPLVFDELAGTLSVEAQSLPLDAGRRYTTTTPGGVAVLSIAGPIMPRASALAQAMGAVSAEAFGQEFDAAVRSPDVRSIVLAVDSDGGRYAGTPELANQIYNARGSKPIESVITFRGFSAALYLASAADRVTISPSADLGSVGVIMMHVNQAKMLERYGLDVEFLSEPELKRAGNPVEPLEGKAREQFESRLKALAATFRGDLAKFRGVSEAHVAEKFGQGFVLRAPDAVAAGAADRIATLETVIAEHEQNARGAAGGGRTGQSAGAVGGVIIRSEGETVNEQLKKRLIAAGLIGAESSDAEAYAAGRAALVARGLEAPTETAALETALGAVDWTQPAANVNHPAGALPAANTPPSQPAGNQPSSPAQAAGQGTSATATVDNPAAAPASPPPADTAAATLAENQRIREISAQAQTLGISDREFVDGLIADPNISAQAAASQMINHLSRSEAVIDVDYAGAIGRDPTRMSSPIDAFGGDVVEAYSGVSAAGTNVEPRPAIQQLAAMPLMELAHRSLAIHGIRNSRNVNEGLVARAVLAGGGHEFFTTVFGGEGAAAGYATPGSIPNILRNAVGKTLMRSFQESDATYQIWTVQGDPFSTLQPREPTVLGDAESLEVQPDGDPTPEGDLNDRRELIYPEPFSKKWRFTQRMMLNDDKSALRRWPRAMALAGRRTVNHAVYDLWGGNVVLNDGNALFDNTNHANDIASGAAPNTAQLTTMTTKLSQQATLSGDGVSGARLKYLVVPDALSQVAEELLLSPANPSGTHEGVVNVHQRRGVVPVVEPYLDTFSSLEYYGVADKMIHDTVEVAFHSENAGGPSTSDWFDPDRVCRYFRVGLIFGVGVLRWENMVRNAGA